MKKFKDRENRNDKTGKRRPAGRQKSAKKAAGRFCLALLLLAALLLCGCGEIKIAGPLDRNILLQINDTSCSMGTAVLRLMEAREEYLDSDDDVLWIRTIGDTTLEEYVMNTVKDELLKYTASEVMAKSMTVFINDREQQKAEEDGALLFEKMGEKYNLYRYGVTLNDAIDLYLKRTYYEKVYDKLSENINMEISEADTKAIEIHYVFVPAEDGIETAERIRNEIKGGAEFADVCRAYGYEPVLFQIETRGRMSAAFENKAFALRDNEVSEIAETRDGFYIIYCLEDYLVTESLANKNRILSDGRRERFNSEYGKFAASNKLRFNTGEWEKIDINNLE